MEPGRHSQTRQRRQVVVPAIDRLDVIDIATALGKEREHLAERQAAND